VRPTEGAFPQAPSPKDLAALLGDLTQPEARALLRLLQAGRTLDEAPVQEAAARLQAALPRRAETVPEPLAQALKALVRQPEALRTGPAGVAEGAPPARAAAAAPESWEAWIRSSVRTLGDPAASPREAPFHLAQAREGTAYFELPLPWAPQAPLQMWVERDSRGQGRGGEEEVRVLLGLSFTRLGETRLGIRQSGAGLQVRVWAQHPGALEAARPDMERELAALGRPVDLKVLPLDPAAPVPSIRALAAGSSFQALG